MPFGGRIDSKQAQGVHRPQKPPKSGRGQGFPSQNTNSKKCNISTKRIDNVIKLVKSIHLLCYLIDLRSNVIFMHIQDGGGGHLKKIEILITSSVFKQFPPNLNRRCRITCWNNVTKTGSSNWKTRWRRPPYWNYKKCRNSFIYDPILVKFETQILNSMYNIRKVIRRLFS